MTVGTEGKPPAACGITEFVKNFACIVIYCAVYMLVMLYIVGSTGTAKVRHLATTLAKAAKSLNRPGTHSYAGASLSKTLCLRIRLKLASLKPRRRMGRWVGTSKASRPRRALPKLLSLFPQMGSAERTMQPGQVLAEQGVLTAGGHARKATLTERYAAQKLRDKEAMS